MSALQSKVTAQGQISVPAEIRRKLGIGPGSILEWSENEGTVTVRKAGRFSSLDIHRALFGPGEVSTSPADAKDAIRKYIRRKHARR